MPVESRARITLLLPAPTDTIQRRFIDGVLTQLIGLCGGVTTSSQVPPVMAGLWVDGNRHVVADSIVVVVADAPLDCNDPKLLEYLALLKQQCQRDFGQEIIWVTVNPIQRITDGENVAYLSHA